MVGRMQNRLFLLDGMALAYRAHFALIARPIFTSRGVNSSALYGFTQTLLEILKNQKPTHIAVVFDTDKPTHRDKEFAAYKAERQAMPEDLRAALPHVCRMIEAFNIPVLSCDGYEADDVIGTLVRRAEKAGFTSYMVTPDKDFGQLISPHTYLYKPSRMGEGVEVLGVPEVLAKYGIQRPEQVVDIIALWGDASDNIPGVPGIGEKTASKLIGTYGTVENVLAHSGELKGKLKESLETHRDDALMSKRLATIICDAPCDVELEQLRVRPPNEPALKAVFTEFEFNSIGRRVFGDDFRVGPQPPEVSAVSEREELAADVAAADRSSEAEAGLTAPADRPPLRTLADTPHDYRVADTLDAQRALVHELGRQVAFGFLAHTDSRDSKQAHLLGFAFSFKAHSGWFAPLPLDPVELQTRLEVFRPILENESIEKVGYHLKFDLSVLRWHNLAVQGKLFDTMLAHSLVEPDLKHSLEFQSEAFLGYLLTPVESALGEPSEGLGLVEPATANAMEAATERIDITWQLRAALEPLLKEKGQQRVFYEVESPLIPVLVAMEYEGIRVDVTGLEQIGAQLSKQIDAEKRQICHLAGREFNVDSPKQLGEILFDVLRICEGAKKTRTGQYSTDERTLLALAPDHEIVRRLLEYREMTKLKSTYVDALPGSVFRKTGRIHTTYHQTATATGRLNSQNPNLQNIPIRRDRGREVRNAFVARGPDYQLLSADYSQIELRIIAALSREPAMLDAFNNNIDIHTATAARVFNVSLASVSPDMRRKAKMVNYGLAYGLSAFGLSQRLSIPRKEAAAIMDHYFAQFPGIRKYMVQTIEFARTHGYVETVTGRRRYLRDIHSANATVRGAAERNAINMPIQGTAADMIKVAMVKIHDELNSRNLKSRMLLQVHDELVFDVHQHEEAAVRALVEHNMKTAIPLDVPIVVEIGVGKNWLEAH